MYPWTRLYRLFLGKVRTHDRPTLPNYHITITAIAQLKLETTNYHHPYGFGFVYG